MGPTEIRCGVDFPGLCSENLSFIKCLLGSESLAGIIFLFFFMNMGPQKHSGFSVF